VKINISNAEKKIHSSGHATQTELQLMLRLINPDFLMPVHGEFKMITALKRDGEEVGIKKANVLQVSNGQIIELKDKKAYISGEVIDIFDVFVDGNKINRDATGVLKYRKILSSDGVVNVTVLLDRKVKKVLELPIISIRGSFYAKTCVPLITRIIHGVKEKIEEAMNRNNAILQNADVRKIVENTVQYFI
jgi:ribonuclease J